MTLRLLRNLNIFFSIKLCRYNRKCDDFVKRVIADGEIVDWYCAEVKVKYKDDYYLLWKENKYYACLTTTIKLPTKDTRLTTFNDIIFNDVRPSRKTEIKFFNWLEEHNIT